MINKSLIQAYFSIIKTDIALNDWASYSINIETIHAIIEDYIEQGSELDILFINSILASEIRYISIKLYDMLKEEKLYMEKFREVLTSFSTEINRMFDGRLAMV